MIVEDRELVDRVCDGDQQAFRTLVERYQRLVFHIVGRLLSDRQDQEDVCQEVFLRVYKHLGGFKREAKLSTWIGTIAYNSAATFLSRSRSHGSEQQISVEKLQEQLPAPGQTPAAAAETGERAEMLRAEIDRLPPEYGVVVALFHLEEMRYEEIAGIMKLPLGTIKSHLFRARKMLKERLTARYRREEIWQ
jgi:RNA polymerase sigma-70 factor (ECF subfamily)